MDPIRVDDPCDVRLVPYTGLTDEALRRRRELPTGDLSGLFICEGALVTQRALGAGLTPVSALVTEDLVDRVPAIGGDAPVYVGSPEVVEAVTGYRFHRGFVAAFRRPPTRHPASVLDGARRVLVCENVTNPTNLGVMVRSAAALGIDALLLDPASCDPLYRRVVRVSMGAVFKLPHARLEGFPRGLDLVAKRGFRMIGLRPDPASTPLGSIGTAPRMALVVGAEGPGLSPATMARMDEMTHIPMTEGVDSLNVAAAAAIAAYVLGGLDRSTPGTDINS